MGVDSVVTVSTTNVGSRVDGVATGTVSMTGGLFSANTINMGVGGHFNFTGGRLAVNTFNTYGSAGALQQEGGTLAPGFSLSDRLDTSLPGFSVINGDYVMEDGLLEIELFGTTAGTGYDQLQVNGEVNLAGGALDLMLHFGPAEGDEFVIIQNDGIDDVVGRFASLPQGAWFTETYSGAPYNFWINYYGLTGNDVVLRAGTPPPPPENVPAPSSLVLAVMGSGLLGWLRRWRAV